MPRVVSRLIGSARFGSGRVGSGRAGARPRLTIYTREGCGLCAQAEALVAREAGRADVARVDVDDDPALVQRYGVRVPVVVVDGVEAAELQVRAGQVRTAVKEAARVRRRR